jgi:4-phosphopantoate--beta-alanine ligase
MSIDIPAHHPRAQSLHEREKLVHGVKSGITAQAGLIAHGRGEAFDYLIGECTIPPALAAIRAAARALVAARLPVISVNGNVAALCPEAVVALAKAVPAALEVNLFYRSPRREKAIAKALRRAGAGIVLGVGRSASARIPLLESARGQVDPRGIYRADVVLVALEDGDRTERLVRLGKTVIAIDLNPLSRTAQYAHITIVDNVVRALPAICAQVQALRSAPAAAEAEAMAYDNRIVLGQALSHLNARLAELARIGVFLHPEAG